MPRRTQRYFGGDDGQALLAAISSCRKACVTASIKAPIDSDVYRSTQRLMDAIDDLAGVLTGDREHFHDKPSPAPSSK